jgi:hypothetical protein
VSVSSTALPNLTEAPLTPFCQFRQFLIWGSAKNRWRSLPRLGEASVVRGGARECFCNALEELRAFPAARDAKTTHDRARTPNGGFSLTPTPRTDKIDKRPRSLLEGWGAEDMVGEIMRPKSGAGINFRLYRAGEITRENAVQWITCAILHRREVPFDYWRRHAPAVEAALTLLAQIAASLARTN